ncbi:MAG TPA: aminotransferase class I/II-fold pyridoxal phosphate-dependent enzyme [Candidatus Limnocylindrales bacterium]|nr:aminotransferase class I/II-fold pyridoxal phosphate-dependent enzyme [Candidatus Limnocylindrales bacterium]
MPQPSRRSQLIPFSPIRTMFRLADEMERAGGGPVFRLHVGDPDFAPPASVVEATAEALRAGKTHYAPTAGVQELRVALAEKARARNGLAASTEQVIITPGSTQALFATLEILFGHGDEVLVPEIYWPNYVQEILLLGGRPVFYPLGAGYQPELGALRGLVTPKTRAIMINSPSNPTGAVFPEATLRAFYELACERDLWILSDEAYEDFVFSGAHVSPGSFERDLPEEKRRVFTLYTFSKSYAMTGLRLGCVVAPSLYCATLLRKCQEPLVASSGMPIQWGALPALGASERAGVERMKTAYQRRRDLALSILKPAGMADYVPEGAFYIMADVSATGMSGDEFAETLLKEERVAVAPGSGFAIQPRFAADGTLLAEPSPSGAPEYPTNPKARHRVRIAFCVSDEELGEGLRRMVRFAGRRRTGEEAMPERDAVRKPMRA